jgi:hypothetical protein
MGVYTRAGLDELLLRSSRSKQNTRQSARFCYPRVRGTRRSRAAIRATTRRVARATRPIRSTIVSSVARDSRRWWRSGAHVSKSEHDAIEVNPPDGCLDHAGIPVRRKEIDSAARAFRESLREADFGPAGAHVDQGESQQVAGARFKDNGPPACLARMLPQFPRVPACRLTTRLAWDHPGRAYRRHRASHRATVHRLARASLTATLFLRWVPASPSWAAGYSMSLHRTFG